MASSLRLSLLSLSLGCTPVVGDGDTESGSSGTTMLDEPSTSTTATTESTPTTTTGTTTTNTTSSESSSGSESSSRGTTNTGTTDGSSSSSGSTSTGETEGSGSTGFQACPGQPEVGVEAGEACTANLDCLSGVCPLSRDVPVDEDAVCGGVPAECRTRFTGTVRDLVTQAPIAGDVAVLSALDALTNPLLAEPDAAGTSSAAGAYDFLSDGPLNAPIGVVGFFVGDATYATSGAGLLADGDFGYPGGPDIHELWAARSVDLQSWSGALTGDVDPDHLPLGEQGGIVGFVRDVDGNRVAGAVVAPENGGSSAQVFYPQADGSVLATMTDATGLFVIVGGAATGEDYTASALELTGSSRSFDTTQVVFSLPITVE